MKENGNNLLLFMGENAITLFEISLNGIHTPFYILNKHLPPLFFVEVALIFP